MAALGARHLPVTEGRKSQFLAALVRTGGILSAACREVAIDPTVNHGKPCYSTWKLLLKNDAEFSAQVAEIMDAACGEVESEIMRRGQEGWLEPIYQKGERVMDTDERGRPIKATIRRFSDKLLLARARALMPNQYGDKRQHSVIHSGHVTHSAGLSMSDIRALAPEQRDKIEAAFSILQGVRDGEQKALTHSPGEILDAEFETVEAVEAVEAVEVGLSAEEAEKAFPL